MFALLNNLPLFFFLIIISKFDLLQLLCYVRLNRRLRGDLFIDEHLIEAHNYNNIY